MGCSLAGLSPVAVNSISAIVINHPRNETRGAEYKLLQRITTQTLSIRVEFILSYQPAMRNKSTPKRGREQRRIHHAVLLAKKRPLGGRKSAVVLRARRVRYWLTLVLLAIAP